MTPQSFCKICLCYLCILLFGNLHINF